MTMDKVSSIFTNLDCLKPLNHSGFLWAPHPRLTSRVFVGCNCDGRVALLSYPYFVVTVLFSQRSCFQL